MSTDEISRCFTQLRPVATLYLETPSADPRAATTAARRWKGLRRQLERDGAPTGTLEAMDVAVGVDSAAVEIEISPADDNVFRPTSLDDQADHAGGDVLAIIAAGNSILLRRFMPSVRSQGEARVGPLPWLIPVLRVQQGAIPHVLVLLDRQGADVWAVDERGETTIDTEVQGNDFQISLVNQGGLSHRRIHERAVNRWEENAKEVASEVADVVRSHRSRALLVGGDVYAVGFFVDALPGDVAPLVHQLETGARGPESGPQGVAHEVRRRLRTIEAEETTSIVQRFDEQFGRRERAAGGPAEVVAALQMANVAMLLVSDDSDDQRRAWFGLEPTHLALDQGELEAMGVTEFEEAALVDVCLRAAFGTGSEVRVVPRSSVPGSIGALLRAVPGGRRE